ncbi:MAG TPA: hypothetical protein VFZ83_08960, partial [Acidimicrobiia bacterium]|nr:hypothetical protein [Acidimicrobiia bacterium]
ESPEHGPQVCAGQDDSYPPQCSGPAIVGWDWDTVDGEESASGTTWGSWHVIGTWDGAALTLTEPPSAPRAPEPDPDDDSRYFPGCDEPEVVDAAHGGAEWEAMSQDFGPFAIPGEIVVWVSDPQGPWDGPFTANVVVRPGSADAARAAIRAHYGGPLCIEERDAATPAERERVQRELYDDDAKAVLGEVPYSSGGGIEPIVSAGVWVVTDEMTAYVEQRWGDLVVLEPLLTPVD